MDGWVDGVRSYTPIIQFSPLLLYNISHSKYLQLLFHEINRMIDTSCENISDYT